MQYQIIFNENYVSSHKYIKVSVFMKKDYRIGIFAVCYNPRTHKIQMQRDVNPSNVNMIIEGKIPCKIKCLDFDLSLLKKQWQYLEKDVKNAFKECVTSLPKSFKKYLELDNEISADKTIKDEIINKLNKCIQDFKEIYMKDYTSELEEEQEPIENWVNVQLQDMSSDDLCELTQKIANEKNPANGVEFKGKYYRIYNGGHELILQVNSTDGGENTNENIIQPKVREFIRMVKMINADGLNDFIKGNFYMVNDVNIYNGEKYYLLTDNRGVNHSIVENRLQIVSVYTEPPTE